MKKLSGKRQALVGFTLFSMFFGAGNLIFPPGVGAQAGTLTWPAMLGMAFSAVGLPVLGVVAVARSGGLAALGNRVHPLFSRVFTILAYLSIGPCLAIPRTASTSFEMAVPPFAGPDAPLGLLQLLYSLVFFAAALWVALRPEKLTDRLGKVMCPILILLIVVTFVGCLVNPLEGYGPPQDAAYEREEDVVKSTVRAGWIAGAMLLSVYSMLAHVGALSGGAFPGAANGAVVLTNIVPALFGKTGSLLLAAIFVIACFNVCVGLISSCGEYFSLLWPRFSYRGWAAMFAVVSMAIANAGLDLILRISVPVLGAIYPVAIVLIALSFFQKRLAEHRCAYSVPVAVTGVCSVLFALKDLGVPIPLLDAVPLASIGLGWVIPALLGILVGVLLPERGKQ